MKLSVSLSDEDVAFLDQYMADHAVASRSAALQQAIRLLRASELAGAYAAAFTEWDEDDSNRVWDSVISDS
jgi:Arc/MetJ-type ribon-helix-helix transcriptional regulator